MEYVSTRLDQGRYSFEQVALSGLAPDGGLYLPSAYPDLSGKLSEFAGTSFCEKALLCLSPFLGDALPQADLQALIDKSYATFDHPLVTPLRHLCQHSVLELFHGPTCAFKDVALQLLGNVLDYLIQTAGRRPLCLIGATSGDTGSAAIHGMRGKRGLSIFMLHPRGRVSPVQEWQMTSVNDANVFNLSIAGTFDDCQRIVKELFADTALNQQVNLGAVNSINCLRVLAQVVYYFEAYFQYIAEYPQSTPVRFCVPTGNFGNVFAGYLAGKMGLPLHPLLVATNSNDMVARVISSGRYQIGKETQQTISPSMDVQVASNFERFLYDVSAQDKARVATIMQDLAAHGSFALTPDEQERTQAEFDGIAIDEAQTAEAIRQVYKTDDYILDPHTAVAYAAACRFAAEEREERIICLGTAHPAKFVETVEGILGVSPPTPTPLQGLADLPKSSIPLPAETGAVKRYILENYGVDTHSTE